MAKPKIFVSHSTQDNDFATRLVNHLNAAEAQAWMDTNDAGAGNFQQRINEALADCEWFLLVLTRNALASPWVRQEVDAANRLKNQGKIKDLIFIKAGDVDYHKLPPLWGVFNILDATGDYTLAIIKVLKAVGLISQPETTPSIPSWYPTYSPGAVGSRTPVGDAGALGRGLEHVVGGAAGAIGGVASGRAHEVGSIEHGIAAHLPGHHSNASTPTTPPDVAEWTCSNCGKKNRANATFCEHCGQQKP
jgi:hypothetical protein